MAKISNETKLILTLAKERMDQEAQHPGNADFLRGFGIGRSRYNTIIAEVVAMVEKK